MSVWRPMSEAPRDGTWVLAKFVPWYVDADELQFVLIKYGGHDMEPCPWWYLPCEDERELELEDKFIGWQPIIDDEGESRSIEDDEL